jgi:hypothetical protein
MIVDACRIWPVGLDCDDAEPVMPDQLARDRCPRAVEFRRAVGGLAQQHDAGIAEPTEESAEFVRTLGRGNPLGALAHHLCRRVLELGARRARKGRIGHDV